MKSRKIEEKIWNPNIQALRGLSILLVLIAHLFDKPGQFGALGVGIFFCISGYLISDILISEFSKTGEINFAKFYLRRARRLLPLAYLVILIVVIISGFVNLYPTSLSPIAASQSYGGFKQYLLSAIFTIFYIGNFFGLAHLGYKNLSVGLGHFWTLAVEEQFYFVWPLVLQKILKYWPRKLTAILLLGIVLTPGIHLFFSIANKSSWTLPTSYLDLFFFGTLFAIYKERIANLRIPLALVALGSLAAALLVYYNVQVEDFSSQGYTLFAFTEIILFLGFLNWSAFGKIRILCKLGDWSYALYCIHWPIITLLHGMHINSVVKVFLAALISLILAALSTKYLETIFWKPRYRQSIGPLEN